MGIGQLGELNDNPEECVCVYRVKYIHCLEELNARSDRTSSVANEERFALWKITISYTKLG